MYRHRMLPKPPGFAARLLAALLVAVGLVLLITLQAVNRATAIQVHGATTRLIAQSAGAFLEMEAQRKVELARLGRSFTASPRTSAALEAALESGDMQWLGEMARYELELNMLPRSLVAFTDAAGTPVATLLDGESIDGEAARIRPLVAQLVEGAADEVLTYRFVRDALYLVQVLPLDFHGLLIGTVVFGLPLEDEDAGRMGATLNAELCFVAHSRCIAGTAGSNDVLRTLLVAHAGAAGSALVQRDNGERWLVLSEPMVPGEDETWRVTGVPVESALRPFSAIRRAIRFAGLGALGLGVVLSILLSRRLTRPVRALVAATERVSHGDYAVRVNLARRDELGVLATAFNAMAEGLELKERYRGVLDKVVSPEVARDLVAGEVRLGGETREITTLFADITAFSDLVDGMEPQQVIALLNECMALLEGVVHAHGGIVDKYIGDEIMAVFGAPVSSPDDVQHAVDAALAMQDAMLRLNALRLRRGDPALSLCVGLHTGAAVAGNVGSPRRLNYTVVGDAVNLAKRLCSAAAPGQIVLTRSTWDRVRERAGSGTRAHALGPRRFKGFATAIEVVSVTRAAQPPAARPHAAAVVMAALLAATAWFAAPLRAQGFELPTLEQLGLRYSSPSGSVQLAFGGRLDLETFLPQPESTGLMEEARPFGAVRLRVLADLFLGDHVHGVFELRADQGHVPGTRSIEGRIQQAILRARPLARADVVIQVGKFASPFGAHATRRRGDADPLIRPPLPYDLRTLASPVVVPGSLAGFLGWKEEAHQRRTQGAPVVWDVPYPWGAQVALAARSVDMTVALTGSAPSAGPEAWRPDAQRFRHPNVTVGAAWRPVAELSFGAAWNRGAWLNPAIADALPEGATVRDFQQQTLSVDAAYARGRTSVRAELFHNRWQVPNLEEDPLDTSYWIEVATRTAPGVHIAARYGEIRFSRMDGGGATSHTGERWDANQRRVQIGGGYRIMRNAGIRGEYMVNRTSDIADPRDDLFTMQLWWEF